MARIAGVFYLITIITGSIAVLTHGTWSTVSGLIAGLSYIAVTVLLYRLFSPVSRGLSLLACLVSLAGCAIGPLSLMLKWNLSADSPLVFFGIYCLLIGYLIARSTFMPKVVGALMAFAGLGWLTFAYPPLAHSLYPYVFAPGLLGEGALTVWLIVGAVDTGKWNEQAGTRAR
jgi:hypothetical protein